MIYVTLFTVGSWLLIVGLCFLAFRDHLALKREIVRLTNENSTVKEKFVLLQSQRFDPDKFVNKDVHFQVVKEKEEFINNLISKVESDRIAIEEIKKEKEAVELKNGELHSKQKSEQVRLGQISEQLVPFLDNFAHDPKKLRALFSPIDYVCFEDERITFIEVKSGDSQLSQKQKNIKKLIEEKEVYFEVYRIKAQD